MSYRIGHKPPPRPNRTMQAVATTHTAYVMNGHVSDIPFSQPQLYPNLDSPKCVKNPDVLHEFKSYIRHYPNVPFHRYKNLFENCTVIHIMDEYSVTKADGTVVKPEVEVALAGDLAGVSVAKTDIRDYIIDVWFSANCPSCEDEIGKERFTVRLKYPILSSDKTSVTWGKEIACNGTLIVKPAIL